MLRVCLFLVGLTVALSHHDPFYRKDYTYFDEFDAFYKLHWDLNGLSWGSAFLACDDEGSTLFYPKLENEWTVVKKLTSAMQEKPNVTEVYVGIHNEFGLGEFITVDGKPTPSPIAGDQTLEVNTSLNSCVLMDIETGAYSLDSCDTGAVRPFVCKKVEEESCPTIDNNYKYVKETRKCYKINQRRKTWNDAMATCVMEGAVLVVIENDSEAAIIKDLMPSRYGDRYFVGFRKLFQNGEFYTVKGRKFDDVFFQRWYHKENEGNQECGSIRTSDNNNNYIYETTNNCLDEIPFICEMNAK